MRRRDEKLQADVAVKFDMLQVYNELYNNSESEMFDEDAAETETDQIEGSNESIDELISPVCHFQLKLNATASRKAAQLWMHLGRWRRTIRTHYRKRQYQEWQRLSNANVYDAPNFAQLDESLQENFKEFLVNLIPGGQEELMAFMKEYAVAQEAGMYQNWLGEVRDILKQ